MTAEQIGTFNNQEAAPIDRPWYCRRQKRLQCEMVKSALAVSDEVLTKLREQGMVMVNIADVVHDRIGPDTIRIAIGESIDADEAAQTDKEGREALLNFEWLTAELTSLKGLEVDPNFDPYVDGEEFDRLDVLTMRALVTSFVADNDLLDMIVNETRIRKFPETACSRSR